MTAPLFMDAGEVAAALEMPDRAAFLRARDRLVAEHGFPAPVPWTRTPLKWRRADVIAWRDALYTAPDLSPATGPARGDAARRVVMLQNARMP